MTDTLAAAPPPGCVHRGQLLLSGRIRPADAEPLTLAYATKHILTHRDLDRDPWHRDRTEQALAELRMSLGSWPWSRFGEATLRAITANLAERECRRCRARLIASVYGLAPPVKTPAIMYLLGGCRRCL